MACLAKACHNTALIQTFRQNWPTRVHFACPPACTLLALANEFETHSKHGFEHSWLTNPQLTGIHSIGDEYVAGLYWAYMTMTTVGYGDMAGFNAHFLCRFI